MVDGPETMELLTGEATKLLRLEKEVMADGRGLGGSEHKLKTDGSTPPL